MRGVLVAVLLAIVRPSSGVRSGRPEAVRARPARTRVRLKLVPAPSGNEARFRVKEQLAMLTMPNVAVGVTRTVSGAIVLENGKVVAGESRFSVALGSLQSDRERRDGYIKRRTLEDFGMTQPRVAVVLSVEDDIGLEYQFHLVRDTTAR